MALYNESSTRLHGIALTWVQELISFNIIPIFITRLLRHTDPGV
jgi:hypothetical protein